MAASGGVMYSGTSFGSQNYAESLTGCTVTFTASAGRKLLITWDHFDVEESSPSGCADTLTIYDGSSDSATVLNTDKCGNYPFSTTTSRYPSAVSTGNSITVKLITDANDAFNDFKFICTSFSTAGKHLL